MEANRFRMMTVLLGLVVPGLVGAATAVPYLWQQSWNSPLGENDESLAVTAAGQGGSLTLVRSGSATLSVLRYQPDGSLAWANAGMAQSGAPADIAVADDGGAILASIDTVTAQLVVQHVDSVTGAVQWQRTRTLTGMSWRTAIHGPRLAVDPTTGRVRIALADHDDWLIVGYTTDGKSDPDIRWSTPAFDTPIAIVADRAGGFIVAGYEWLTQADQAIRTVAFDAEGVPRYSDREIGQIGSMFEWVPIRLALADNGGVNVLGGSESRCGVLQAILWRLDADGRRAWTTGWHPDPCQAAKPVGLYRVKDDSMIVAALSGGTVSGFHVKRVDADGDLVWHRRWLGETLTGVQPACSRRALRLRRMSVSAWPDGSSFLPRATAAWHWPSGPRTALCVRPAPMTACGAARRSPLPRRAGLLPALVRVRVARMQSRFATHQ